MKKLSAVGAAVTFAARAALRFTRRYDLRAKVAVVTGGSRGLGLVLARELAARGAQVAICARDAAALERARADLGGDALAVACDVTIPADVGRMIDAVRARFGRIDVLVNNAGVIEVGPMDLMTDADFERAFRTHVWGPLHAMRAVLPEMRARRSGRIVNIASIGGKLSVPHLLPYSASKFALVGLSAGMRAEVLRDGVYITTACPGLVRTGSPRHATFKGKHRAEYAWFAIADSLPLVSISAEAAARDIVDALEHGDAEVVVSAPAQLATKLAGLLPNLTQELLGVVARFLPGPGTAGTEAHTGAASASAAAPSILTALTERAAARNNENN